MKVPTAAAFSAVLLAASSAHAYRTLADESDIGTDVPPTWDTQTPTLELWSDLPPPAGADAFGALTRAADEWSTTECSSWQLDLRPTAASPPAPGDGRNTIGLIASGWEERGLHPDAGATTDVQLVREEGSDRWRIVEADVYVDWTRPWALEDSAADGTPSLSLVLAHELGHVAGFAHPCELDSEPICDAVARESILYPAYASRPVSLSADDVEGLCALYPRAACSTGCPSGTHCESGSCVPVPSPTCDAGGADCGSCTSDAECDPALRCSPASGTCVLPGARGAGCLSGGDCASELCVAGATPVPFCTIACEADAMCGAGERCRVTDGVRVCAPSAASSGCAVRAGDRSTQGVWVTSLALGVVLLISRRRR